MNNKDGIRYSCTDTWRANFTMEAKVKLDSKYVADGAIGVVARFTDDDNQYRFIHSNGAWQLSKCVDGTVSTLVVGPKYALAIRAEHDVKLVADGPLLEGYVNGVLHCSATDTDLVSGRAGLYSYQSKGVFDDVVFHTIESAAAVVPSEDGLSNVQLRQTDQRLETSQRNFSRPAEENAGQSESGRR